MALNTWRFVPAIAIVENGSYTPTTKGEINVADSKLRFHNGTTSSPVVTESHAADISNKTYASASLNAADSGVLRLGNDEEINWRNAANNANLTLKVNALDQLEYNGNTFLTTTGSFSNDTVVVTDSTGTLVSGAASTTEVDRLVGVTSLIQNQLDTVPTFTASVSASNLTIDLKNNDGSSDPSSTNPVIISFRSSTETSGEIVKRSVTGALSLTLNDGSTLGHSDNAEHFIYVYAIDNAGTVELGASARLLNEALLYTTVAEGTGAAVSPTELYTQTARSDVPVKLIGRIVSTQTVAGTFDTAPSRLDLDAEAVKRGLTVLEVRGRFETSASQLVDFSGNPDLTVDFPGAVYTTHPSAFTVGAGYNQAGATYSTTPSYLVPETGLYKVSLETNISYNYISLSPALLDAFTVQFPVDGVNDIPSQDNQGDIDSKFVIHYQAVSLGSSAPLIFISAEAYIRVAKGQEIQTVVRAINFTASGTFLQLSRPKLIIERIGDY